MDLLSKENNEKYMVPSVDHAARILHFLSRVRHKSHTLNEIQQSLAIPRTTCMRILKTLHYHGLIHYHPLSKQYSLGPYLIVLGKRAEGSLDYLKIAASYLPRVVEATNLTAFIVHRVREDRLTYVAKEDSLNTLHLTVSLGQQFPVEPGLFGKCFCAFMREEERLRVAPRRARDPEFVRELEQVRRNGYAVTLEDQMEDVVGVASPVFGPDGESLMALAAVGLAHQLTGDSVHQAGSAVRRIAGEITEHIGGTWPSFSGPL